MKLNPKRVYSKSHQDRQILRYLVRNLLILLTFGTLVAAAMLLRIKRLPQKFDVEGFEELSACNISSPLTDKWFHLKEQMDALNFTGDLLRMGRKWQPSRSDVLIVSYMRSGSSFVGQIFNQHPDIFYVYEPLEILTALEMSDSLVLRSALLHLLQVIYSCHFEEHPFYASKISVEYFRLMSRALSYGMCKANATQGKLHLCTQLDPHTLNELCKSHKHTVVKSIRIEDLSLMYNGLAFDIERPWDSLNVLHLVRDPRAVVSSRLSLAKTSTRSPLTSDQLRQRTRELCDKIWNNLIKVAHTEWINRYHIIRYEDVAEKPLASAKELFHFTDIQESSEVFEWLEKNTNVAYQTGDFSTTKNATVSVNKWRWEAGFGTVYVVQQECRKLMNVLGYRMLANASEMANLRESLVLPMSPKRSVFITRSVHRSIREMQTEPKMQ